MKSSSNVMVGCGTLLAALGISISSPAAGAAPHFAEWPDEANPEMVGRRVAENFLPRKYRCEVMPEKASIGIIYPEVITWYGALRFASEAGDQELSDLLVRKFDPLLKEPGALMINPRAHVDFRVFGAVPLEIDMLVSSPEHRRLGLQFADAQWENPDDDGLTREARFWIDDAYMISLIQVQALRATGKAVYADRAALMLDTYLKRMQQPNGLFHHGEDSPFFWGRGNGWMAAGAAELLRSLPEDHPKRAGIMEGYRKMMAALLGYQSANGMWRQLVDQPDSWPESSGTAMFAFAMAVGVNEGWLDAEIYGPAVRKAWLALTGLLDPQGNLGEVCVGTDKGHSLEYYLERPRVSGDLHGQAPILWTAAELLR
jgi:rhamnogalacturonyl hydrolase YesR